MKKLGRTAILAVLIVILSALLFVACDKGGSQSPSENDNHGNQEHQHTYSQKWNYNENYHWHEATCEHDSLTIDYGKHNFDNDVCTICNYKREAKPKIFFSVDDEIYSSVETKGNEIIAMPSNPTKAGYDFIGWFWDKDTWKRPFTANSMLNEPLKSDMTVYAYFEKTHAHTFDDAWTSDSKYHWHKATCEHDLISDKDEHNFDSSRVCTICGYRDTALHGVELKTNTLSINGANISGKVSNETTSFSFVDEISVADSATYTVSTDINGSHTIRTKTVNLAIGDNTFYILVENGKDIKLYTVQIRRRPIYTVTFDSKGGTAVEQQQVEENGFAVEPNTTRIGYDFDKWDYDLSKPILKDETITASWSAIKYTITYLLDGGANNSDNPLTYTIEDEITLLPPTKVGYTGIWNNDGKIEIGSVGNKTFTAIYTANKYNVQLVTDGKCYVANDGAYDCDTQVTVSLTTLYLGYDFLGWYDGDTLCSKEQSYTFTMPANDICLTAKTVVKNEMQIFYFSSTENTCVIEKIKDEQIQSVTIPYYVTSIGNYAFDGCIGLTEVTFGSSVTSIGDKAFRNCIGLTVITIPDSVTSIGDRAFGGCKGLTSITIPSNVANIGSCAFYGCSSLVTVNWNATDCIRAGDISDKNYYYSGIFLECTKLTTVNIGNNVTGIPSSAFYGCSGVTDITIPDSVTSIGHLAFGCCSNLTTVNWNAKDCTFAGVSGSHIFYSCSGLTTINIGDNVTTIPSYAFYDCSGLTSITIPDGVTSIGESAFSGCTGLTSITIPDSVMSIGERAFYDTAWYNNQPDGLVYAGKVAYKYKGTMPSNTSIVIKDGTLGIADYAFSGCSRLTSITIPDSVTSIGDYAFYECYGLTSIAIPDSVTSIGNSAFYGCSGLTSITIPDSVMSIGGGAFTYCSSLTSVTIGNGVTSIGGSAFSDCSRLTSITIPDSVTSIGWSAFGGCTGLTSITIPDSVTSIDQYAFSNCGSLTNINFEGTKAQWNAISKGYRWNYNVPSSCKIVCTDGTIYN